MSPVQTRRRPILAVGLALLVAVAALTGAAATAVVADGTARAGAADAAAESGRADERLVVTNATVGEDETATLRVALTEVPDGLAGYRLDLELATGGVAAIAGASYPEAFQLTSAPVVDAEGQAVTLEAAIADVEPGASNVTLATVNVTGTGDGSTAIRVADVRIDAEGGERVDPDHSPGTVAVSVSGDDSSGTGETGNDAGADGNGADANGNSGADAAGEDSGVDDDSTASIGESGGGELGSILVLPFAAVGAAVLAVLAAVVLARRG